LLSPFSTTAADPRTTITQLKGTKVACKRLSSPLLPHEQQEQEQEQDVSVNLANVKKNNKEKNLVSKYPKDKRIQWHNKPE
jgi:hypothetical protein